MTRERDLERLLDHWLADGPMEVPDRVIDSIADRIGRQPQHPAWRLLWRDVSVSMPIRFAAAAAALVIATTIGFSVLGRPGGSGIGGEPTASSTPFASSPSGSATPRQCLPSEPSCTGLLAPGTHRTARLLTPLSFEVPAGWSKPLDVPGALNLELEDSSAGFLAVWPDWAVALEAGCTSQAPDPDPAVGRTADDLVTWLTGHPGLVTSTPEPVTVGGLEGQVLDVRMDPNWRGTCPGTAILFTHKGTINDVGWHDITASVRMRLWILDAGGGNTVTIDIQSGTPETFEAWLDAATPIVETFDFSP